MTQDKDDELRQLILSRRARFVAAAMCTSGVVFSACGNGSSDPIVGTIGQTPGTTTITSPSTGASSSSAPTPCLTTSPAPTACLGITSPQPCLSIVLPIPTGDTTTTTAPVDTEPRPCLTPPAPPIDPIPTLGSESTLEPFDAGLDAAPGTDVEATDAVSLNASSTDLISSETSDVAPVVDASVEPPENP